MSNKVSTASFEAFERTTGRWGPITLAVGLILATSVPFYLLAVTDVDVSVSQILNGYLAVLAVYGAFYVVEPLSYFPILGPAGMYQAFLIGNLANKLIPAVVVAQDLGGAKPGTKRGSFTATAAISGAAFIHAVSMILFVAIFGTWLVSVIPESITEVTQLYVLAAIMGGVTVQLASSLKNPRATIAALAVAAVVIFVITPLLPMLASFDVAIAVFGTIAVTWFTRKKNESSGTDPEPNSTVGNK